MSNDIGTLLRYGKSLLKEHSIDGFGLCAELMLMRATGLSRVKLLTEPDFTVDEAQAALYYRLLERCAAHEPTQYILNNSEFMSLDFYVDSSVLIPRPDTETLVEEALRLIPQNARVLEIGAGSGCIAVSIAKNIPDVRITALDISLEAIKIAKENAERHGVCDKIEFVPGDISGIEFNEQYDLVISNPPYIKTEEINLLEKNVSEHEPRIALDGGSDGLFFYRIICRKALHILKSGGIILFEIGADQSGFVYEILQKEGYVNTWIKRDLAGRDRVIGAVLNRSGQENVGQIG